MTNNSIIFQVWLGGLLPPYLELFVLSVKQQFIDSYLFIDDLLATELVEKMPKALRNRYNEMQIFSGKSSILRMFYLSLNPNATYFDCDVELVGKINLPKGRIRFGCFKNMADDFLIVGNNDKKSIDLILQKYIESDITQRGLFWSLFKTNFPVLGERAYKHHRLHKKD